VSEWPLGGLSLNSGKQRFAHLWIDLDDDGFVIEYQEDCRTRLSWDDVNMINLLGCVFGHTESIGVLSSFASEIPI
jgi:hypothetical protein